MAEVRKIVVELRDGEQTTTPKQEPSPKKEANNKNVTNESMILAKSVLLNQAVNTAKRMVISGVTQSINRYLTLTEDYLAEETYHNAMNTISKATTLGGSLYIGAKVGSALGIGGAVVGMGIATVGFVGSNMLNYQAQMSAYHRQINASNINRAYGMKRAGLVDGGKGTDN